MSVLWYAKLGEELSAPSKLESSIDCTHLAEKVMGKSAEKQVMSQDAAYNIGMTPSDSIWSFSFGAMSLPNCHSCTCTSSTGHIRVRSGLSKAGMGKNTK